jgi:hypothetical protein
MSATKKAATFVMSEFLQVKSAAEAEGQPLIDGVGLHRAIAEERIRLHQQYSEWISNYFCFKNVVECRLSEWSAEKFIVTAGLCPISCQKASRRTEGSDVWTLNGIQRPLAYEMLTEVSGGQTRSAVWAGPEHIVP